MNNMKGYCLKNKITIIGIVCILGINILASLFYALAIAMRLNVVNVPTKFSNFSNVIWNTVPILHIAIGLIWGWKISAQKHKQFEIHKKGIFARFIKKKWLVLVLSLIFLLYYLSFDGILFEISGNIGHTIQKIFQNYDVIVNVTASGDTTMFNFLGIFFDYLLLHPATYASMFLAYFAYTFRAELSKPKSCKPPRVNNLIISIFFGIHVL